MRSSMERELHFIDLHLFYIRIFFRKTKRIIWISLMNGEHIQLLLMCENIFMWFISMRNNEYSINQIDNNVAFVHASVCVF